MWYTSNIYFLDWQEKNTTFSTENSWYSFDQEVNNLHTHDCSEVPAKMSACGQLKIYFQRTAKQVKMVSVSSRCWVKMGNTKNDELNWNVILARKSTKILQDFCSTGEKLLWLFCRHWIWYTL